MEGRRHLAGLAERCGEAQAVGRKSGISGSTRCKRATDNQSKKLSDFSKGLAAGDSYDVLLSTYLGKTCWYKRKLHTSKEQFKNALQTVENGEVDFKRSLFYKTQLPSLFHSMDCVNTLGSV